MTSEQQTFIKALKIVIGTIGVMALVCLAGCPQYNVWEQGLAGQAELRRAEQNRQITVEEALADNEAATSRAKARIKIAEAEAEAEVIRAHGVAEANKIIGDSLKGNESYIRYLWVQSLHDGKNDVIYVPTEANLPILEATRKAGAGD